MTLVFAELDAKTVYLFYLFGHLAYSAYHEMPGSTCVPRVSLVSALLEVFNTGITSQWQ